MIPSSLAIRCSRMRRSCAVPAMTISSEKKGENDEVSVKVGQILTCGVSTEIFLLLQQFQVDIPSPASTFSLRTKSSLRSMKSVPEEHDMFLGVQGINTKENKLSVLEIRVTRVDFGISDSSRSCLYGLLCRRDLSSNSRLN